MSSHDDSMPKINSFIGLNLEGKIIKKKIFHSILILLTVVLAVIMSLFVAIQDPIIQKFAVRFAGGYLSEKTGADIKVGRLAVTPDFRVLIDDVMVKDLKSNNLVALGSLRAKIFMVDLLEGEIHLGNVELRDVEANLITYAGEDKMNFAFLVDAFASDTEKEKDSNPVPIIIDRIMLKDVDFVMWNQNRANPSKTERHLMDYSHMAITDINLKANDFYMFGDSIHARIASLSGTELSGFEVKNLETDATVCPKGVFLQGLLMETNNSNLDLDLNMLINGFDDFGEFVDSVVFDATIRPTTMMLSDIGVFTSVMYKMPDLVKFEGRFSGPIEHFRVDDIKAQLGKSTTFNGSISMHPLDFEHGYHTLVVNNMNFTYDDLANFYIPSSSVTIPMPESLSAMDRGRLSLDFKGSYSDFDADIMLRSGVGDIDASVKRSHNHKGDNVFSGNIRADEVAAGTIANAKKYVGNLDLNAAVSMTFPVDGAPLLYVDGVVSNAELLGNHIDEIKLDGNMKDNCFNGKVSVDDEDLSLDFNGLVDFSNKKYPRSDFEAVIRNADLKALKLLKEDSISRISTKVRVNLRGFDIDNLQGWVEIDSTTFIDSRGRYFMKEFNGSIVDDNLMERRINLNCDFFNFEMAGQMNFASLMMAMNEFGDYYVHFPKWNENRVAYQKYSQKNKVGQDFTVTLNLKDPQTLTRLLMPSVSIAKNTTLSGTFTSRTNSLGLTARSKNVQVGPVEIKDIELKNFNFMRANIATLSVDEIVYSSVGKNDTSTFSLENFSFITRLTNDTVFARIKWDDDAEDDRNKALIETYFHPNEQGSIFSITQADVRVNDTTWTVSPDNSVEFIDGRTLLSNIRVSHDSQFINVNGYLPMMAGDTLSLSMHQFDLSHLDVLLNGMGFNLDGFVSGNALAGSLKENPMVLANLEVEGLAMNGDKLGNAVISSSWNNVDKSIGLSAKILNELRRTLNVSGTYYTARKTDNLDFLVELDSLQLNVLNPFLAGIVTRMQGLGHGQLAVTGSIQQPDLDGRITIKDGGCKIDYLKTYYTFNPTILIDNKTISFDNLVLTDTLGNNATVQGVIHHDKLKDFNLDLRLIPRNFLALATTSKDNDTFFGTVVANGLISVTGPFNDIKLNINALTRRGTNLTIPLNKQKTVKENDFIVFVNKAVEEEETEETQPEEKAKSNFSLNLNVNATDDANLKIILPGDIGTIDASGNGSMNMSTSTTEDFKMFGDYSIKNGRFQLVLMDIVTRTFNLKSGTLSWSGDPTDGRIDATGAYSVRASLASLGLQVDSTSNNNVNVECLIHLKGALLNPTITFGMNLPNASEDITQTVFSVLDTTNQAVMQSQALSLLVLNSFSYVGNGVGDLNIVNLLGSGMQMNITDNLNLGLSYHAGNENTYDEYQMSLRTQLFENRLSIETNLGMMSANSANGASSIVGEFDMYYKLTSDGRLQAHFYNHSNYNSNLNSLSFDRRSPYTQGLGLSYSRSFNVLRDLFRKRTIANQPLIVPRKQENN